MFNVPSSMSTAVAGLLLLGSLMPASAHGGFGGGLLRGSAPAGHFGGHGGGRGPGRTRTINYQVIDASSITDKQAFTKAMDGLAGSLANSSGRVLADADIELPANGSAANKHVSIIAFDNATAAQAWQDSAGFKALLTDLRKQAQVDVFGIGGIADPGSPMAALSGIAAGRPPLGASVKLPDPPPFESICKGC